MPTATDLRDSVAVAKTDNGGGGKDLLTMVKDLGPQLEIATRGTPIDGQRFMRIALTEIRRNPQLMSCSPQSVLGGLMLSAQLGLEIGAPLGQSWLIPFRNKGTLEAQWLLGYTGVVALAGRAGVHISGRAVHEADEFSYEIVDGRDVIHHRRELRGDRGPAWLWYATAHWDSGYTAIVLNRSEVEHYRGRSKAKGNGPWVTDFDPMAIKTCVLRLRPWIPITAQVSDAMSADGGVVRGTDINLAELAAATSHELEAAIDVDGDETVGDIETPANADGEPVATDEEA